MTLTEASKNFKRGVKFVALFVVLYYVVVFFVFPKSSNLIKSLIPDRNPPNPVFGKLNALKFQQITLNDPQPKYVLNTKNGRLPRNLPDRMKVYKFSPPQFSYLAKRNALDEASVLGFSENELTTSLEENVYKWKSLQTGGTLVIDTKSRVLTLETELYGKADDFKIGTINEQQATNFTNTLMKRLDRNSSLYPKGEKKVYLGRYQGNTLVETLNNSEAQLARVDWFRSINDFPILGPDPKKGLISMVIRNPTRSLSAFNYPKIEAYYWEIQEETDASYPIISVSSAWESVKNERGIISSVSPKGWNPFGDQNPIRIDSFLIDNIFLAYYETPEFQTYLQPIYVFEGKYTSRGTEGGDVTIYFPAISGDFVKAPAAQPQSQ